MFLTSNQCIPLKHTLGSNEIVSCEGELIVLCGRDFSVVLYQVRAVYKFDFTLATNWTPHKWRPVWSYRCCNTDLRSWQDLYDISASWTVGHEHRV